MQTWIENVREMIGTTIGMMARTARHRIHHRYAGTKSEVVTYWPRQGDRAGSKQINNAHDVRYRHMTKICNIT